MNPKTFIRAVFRICRREDLLPVVAATFNLSARDAATAYDQVALSLAVTPGAQHDKSDDEFSDDMPGDRMFYKGQ